MTSGQERYQALLDRVEDLETRLNALEGQTRASRFTPPTKKELYDYLMSIDARFTADIAKAWTIEVYDHYQANGWMAGRVKMKDWRAAARNSIKWTPGPFIGTQQSFVDEQPQDRYRPVPPKNAVIENRMRMEREEEHVPMPPEVREKLRSIGLRM